MKDLVQPELLYTIFTKDILYLPLENHGGALPNTEVVSMAEPIAEEVKTLVSVAEPVISLPLPNLPDVTVVSETKTAVAPVQIAESQPIEAPAAKTNSQADQSTLHFDGAYTNKILLMYANGAKPLAAELKTLVEKILAAKSVSLSNCAFIDIDANANTAPREILKQLMPEFILTFGLALGVGGNYSLTITGKISLIKADALAVLAQNDDLKKKLWAALKPVQLPA